MIKDLVLRDSVRISHFDKLSDRFHSVAELVEATVSPKSSKRLTCVRMST